MKYTMIFFFFILGVLLNASDDFKYTNMQIGYTHSTLESQQYGKENYTEGVYNSFDLMTPIKSLPDFSYGVSFDINAWNGQSNSITNGYSGYTMGISAKVGYSIYNQTKIPLKFKTGIGYGLIDIGVHDSGSFQYEYGTEFDIYKNFGMGIKYKYSDGEYLNHKIENKNIIYYFYF